MTYVAENAWQWTWWITLRTSLLGVALVVIGALLLRLRGRARTVLLAVAWILAAPYLLILFLGWLNPVRAGIIDAPDHDAGLPWWQPATILILMAAALAQAVGLTWSAHAPARP